MIQLKNLVAALGRDWRTEQYPLRPLGEHLDATLAWLCRAQDRHASGGVAAGYTLHQGWMPEYPETTGYIIPTFLDYAELAGDSRYTERARRMGAWESDIQLADGGVRGRTQDAPVVFDTGQVIFGWVALYERFGDARSLESACRAGDWLLRHQDDDGKWTRFEFKNVPHTYNTRVAWPLLLLARAAGRDDYRRAAVANLEWTLRQEQGEGWFDHMSFTHGAEPFTHTIAYTLEGLLEASLLVPDESLAQRLRAPVQRASGALLKRYALDAVGPAGVGSTPAVLPATLAADWSTQAKSVCLTGNAQFALIWQQMWRQTGDARYLAAADRVLAVVRAQHAVAHPDPAIAGAVAGSSPCWGAYLRLWYPNWAAKFFADALLRRLAIEASAPAAGALRATVG